MAWLSTRMLYMVFAALVFLPTNVIYSRPLKKGGWSSGNDSVLLAETMINDLIASAASFTDLQKKDSEKTHLAWLEHNTSFCRHFCVCNSFRLVAFLGSCSGRWFKLYCQYLPPKIHHNTPALLAIFPRKELQLLITELDGLRVENPRLKAENNVLHLEIMEAVESTETWEASVRSKLQSLEDEIESTKMNLQQESRTNFQKAGWVLYYTDFLSLHSFALQCWNVFLEHSSTVTQTKSNERW